MKIGVFCTSINTVPPKNYGGAQAVNYVFVEELVRRGHSVFLFAPSGSKTSAKLIKISTGWGESMEQSNVNNYLVKYIDKIDVLLDTSAFAIPGRRWKNLPYVNRMGGDTNKRYCQYVDRNMVFPSYSHLRYHSQGDCSCGNRRSKRMGDTPVIYKPVSFSGKLEDLPFNEKKSDYYLCLGLIQEHKGTHYAVEFARKAGVRLRVIGPIGNQKYFNKKIAPYIDDKITYEPPIGYNKKWKVLSKAIATIFTTNCEEGGPNVPLESLIVGTPVIAFDKSTITEYIVDGKTGILCDTIDIMCERMDELSKMKSIDCREHVLKKFSLEKFVNAYENLFDKVIKGGRWI